MNNMIIGCYPREGEHSRFEYVVKNIFIFYF